MRLSKDIVGKPIITINDGRIMGNVKDVLLTTDLSALAGIYLGREGLIRRKTLLIPSRDVVVFGIDAILVTNAEVVTDNKQIVAADDWVRLNKLQGREIDTPGGTRVGTIGDVVLDEEGGIMGFMLSRIYVEGPIAEQRMIYRHAVIDHGNEDGVMTVDISRAEQAFPGDMPAAAAKEEEATPLPAPAIEPVEVDEVDEMPEELEEPETLPELVPPPVETIPLEPEPTAMDGDVEGEMIADLDSAEFTLPAPTDDEDMDDESTV